MRCENRFLSAVYVTTLNTLKKYFIGEILVQSSNKETGTMLMNGIPIYCYIQCMYPWLMNVLIITLVFAFVEAVVQRCSVKKSFLEISHSQENTFARVSFFNKVAGLRLY